MAEIEVSTHCNCCSDDMLLHASSIASRISLRRTRWWCTLSTDSDLSTGRICHRFRCQSSSESVQQRTTVNHGGLLAALFQSELGNMTFNGNSMSQPLILIFSGKSYEFWSIKMKTLFKSQDLWDLIENGYADPDEETRLRENRKKDSKALFFIQQAVHETIFSRIAAAITSKQAWLILQNEFQGSSRVITESKDLSTYSFDELMGSLQVHEARLNRSFEKNEEKAFQIKGESSTSKEDKNTAGRSRGRGGFRGRGNGRGRGHFDGHNEQKQCHYDQKNYKNRIQCHYCKKFGHMKADCWKREKQASYVEENEDNSIRSIFRDIDETHKLNVRLGDNKQIQVEGKGTIEVKTSQGKGLLGFHRKLPHRLQALHGRLASSWNQLTDAMAGRVMGELFVLWRMPLMQGFTGSKKVQGNCDDNFMLRSLEIGIMITLLQPLMHGGHLVAAEDN
ncbi:Retrotransposon protein [Musa troglodytarum]|uniref:Retrotransposon protein n=1 Tax=Musa troglodytarum TaxID=320322 RepID=A0A9E7EXQ3_9LILI|nr:Retrotransposon protein [Musa troglodytarum]